MNKDTRNYFCPRRMICTLLSSRTVHTRWRTPRPSQASSCRSRVATSKAHTLSVVDFLPLIDCPSQLISKILVKIPTIKLPFQRSFLATRVCVDPNTVKSIIPMPIPFAITQKSGRLWWNKPRERTINSAVSKPSGKLLASLACDNSHHDAQGPIQLFLSTMTTVWGGEVGNVLLGKLIVDARLDLKTSPDHRNFRGPARTLGSRSCRFLACT